MNQTLFELIGNRGFEPFRQGLEARFCANRLKYEISYGNTQPNSSLRVRLESKDRIAEICAWELGDCEMSIAELDAPQSLKTMHRRLFTSQDFHEELAYIFRYVVRREFPEDKNEK
jgi:hypothetical protein